MKEPEFVQLTRTRLGTISREQILYAEIAVSGAMGNAGGLMFYLMEEGTLVCYETDMFTDQEVYRQACNLNFGNEVFDYFYGGMGNSVHVNKAITLEIHDGYFVYRQEGIEYKILPSVLGVFYCVVNAMIRPANDGKD